ncbi:MAG: cellulase family glycosylhydrolase [Coriobacteriia bacterium]|nr:cellulase family glycosylhydrolase [Coriobacteriia bacterium]MBN2847268.1 cellulase family glycosylhydrolase [Coriobacteriia bacterium]
MTKPTREAKPTGPVRNALFPVGVDLYPLDDERASFDDWYAHDLEPDLAAMAAANLSLVRVFVSWKLFEPQVGQYDDEAEDRLGEVLASARAHDLKAIVTFFADDRFAEMNDVTWAKKRDPRTDDYLIQREVSLVQRVVNRYRTDPAIWAWELGNEAFFTGFESEDALQKWTAALREAIREVDTARAIMLGVDVETLVRETGVDATAAIDAFEHAVSHVTAPYLSYIAEGPLTHGPATYLDSFLLRCGLRSLPVMADGVGVHSLDGSVAEEAAYMRTALFSTLMNRGAGVMLRRWRDMDAEKREPYFRDPFEVLVGLTDTGGEPKPSLEEVRRFTRTAARLDLRHHLPAPERAAVLIPAERHDPLPSLAGLYDPRSCLQAYIAAKEAHLPVTLVREGAGLKDMMTIFIPSAGKLSPSMWQELGAFVQSGGSVVLSYGGGDADPAIREIFGVDFLGDHGVRAIVSCRVAQPGLLGDLTAFDARLDLPHYALVGGGSATVVATDATGSPLLTLNQYGQGRAVFVAAPLERAIAQSDPWAAPESIRHFLRTVYGSVARATGAGPVVDCDDPAVELALFQAEDSDVVLVLSHDVAARTATLLAERVVASVSDVRGGPAADVGAKSFGVPLGPNGAAALRLTYGG